MAAGRLLSHLSLLTTLLFVSSVYGQNVITDFSVYNETYFWNGQLVIPYPNDPMNRQFIQRGRIFIELPGNVTNTTVLDTRIRERVDVTFDCQLRIEDVVRGLPSSLVSNRRTNWYLRNRGFDGTLGTRTAVQNSTATVIFGAFNRYLRIPSPVLSSLAQQRDEGIFVCEHCFDQVVPGFVFTRLICNQSNGDVNIIGDPPTINRTGMLAGATAFRIGTNVCLDRFRNTGFVQVVCAQNHTINPEPGATYTFNGVPLTSAPGGLFGVQGVPSEPGRNNAVLVILGNFLRIYSNDTTFSCLLANRFGNDTATTRFLFDVSSTFSGSINGVSGTQCDPPRNNTICASVGQTVTLNCTTNNMNSYNITGQGRNMQNNILSFQVNENDYGNYTCVSRNDCNQVAMTVTIAECPPPRVTISTVYSNGSSTAPCYRPSGGDPVFVQCLDADSGSSVVWSINGNRQSTTGNRQRVTSTGTYACETTSACGTSIVNSTVIRGLPVIMKGNSVGSSVDIGGRVCLDNNAGVVRCNVVTGNSPTRRWLNGSTVISETGPSLSLGPYDVGRSFTCEVTDDCGTDRATSTVPAKISASINGTINGLISSDNGCGRPGIIKDDNNPPDLCPKDGETIVISCQTDIAGSTYVIVGPMGQRSINNPLTVMNFNRLVHTGTFTCTATPPGNSPSFVCGPISVTMFVSGSGVPPVVSTLPPSRNPPTLPPDVDNGTAVIGSDICIRTTQGVTIRCNAIQGTPPINYTWTSPPDDMILSRSENFTTSQLGTYRCEARNVFGSSSANTTVLRLLTVNITSPSVNRCSSLKVPPPGTDHCAFLGNQLVLNCSTTDPSIMGQITPGNSGSLFFESAAVSHEGTYVCNATNECGSSTDAFTVRVYDPARVNRTSPLPSPGPNQVVIGADRQTEPATIPDNRTVVLHCPYTGIETPNTTWYRIRRDGHRVPIDTSRPPFSISDNNRTNLVLTITNFNSSLAGTYRCFTTNNAGDDNADVVLQVEIPVEPKWYTSPWTRCDPMCHRGMRMRLVECRNRITGKKLPDNRCSDPKPQTTETCTNLGPCHFSPTWRPKPWRSCSVRCGGGIRLRDIDCIIPATGEDAKGRCDRNARPLDHEYCNTHPCCQKDGYRFCKSLSNTMSCQLGWMHRYCCWSCRGYY